jgi:hypothetical protein
VDDRNSGQLIRRHFPAAKLAGGWGLGPAERALRFLVRAKKFLQDLATEPGQRTQHFNVTCASGHRVRGERTEGYQALRCPACGEGVFVLPRSPLPEPVPPAAPATPKAAPAAAGWVQEGPVELTSAARVTVEVADDAPGTSDAEIIWDDDVAEPPPQPGEELPGNATEPRHSPATPSAAHAKQRVPRKAAPAAPPPAPAQTRADEAARDADRPAARRPARQTKSDTRAPARTGRSVREAAAEPAGRAGRSDPAGQVVTARKEKRTRRQSLLILAVVSSLVVATVIFRTWRRQRQEFPIIAERGRVEGIPALEEGNFDKAYQLLSAAKTAVDSLGGAVEGADKIRGAADEAAIFVDLISQPLEDLLAEAGRISTEAWASKFDTLYKGRAILIDSYITASPDAGASKFEIQYVVLPPGEGGSFLAGRNAAPERFGVLDLTGFELLELARPNVGSRVTFGARLASFQYDGRDNWVIRLEPKSGVFIVHTKALDSLGWPKSGEIGEQAPGKP